MAAPRAWAASSGRPDRAELGAGGGAWRPVDGMFSFFPAMPAEGASGFPRPILDLPAEYFNPRIWRAPRGLRRERSADERRGLWDSLVAHARRSGLVLGTHATPPGKRRT